MHRYLDILDRPARMRPAALPQTLGKILEKSEGLDRLLPHARSLIELREQLAAALPPGLRRQATLANFKNGTLVIFADNSAVAAKLRLMLTALGDRLKANGVEHTGIKVEVQPSEPPLPRRHKQAVMSASGADSLRQLSAQLPDSKLKTVIDRLADSAPGDAVDERAKP
jgi:hypothetical protein